MRRSRVEVAHAECVSAIAELPDTGMRQLLATRFRAFCEAAEEHAVAAMQATVARIAAKKDA